MRPAAPGPGPPSSRRSPGGGRPRSRLLRRASARPAGRRLMGPASPSPSPPRRHRCRHRLLRLSPQPRLKPLPPGPPPPSLAPAPAAGTRGEAPAHCVPRWGWGASRLGLGAGARLHVRLGRWEGGRPERATPSPAPTFRDRLRALPGGPVGGGGARWRGAGGTPALGAGEPGWTADLARCSTGSSPPV